MFNRKRFTTPEWLFLIGAAVVALAFLPGAAGAAGIGRVIGTLYGLIPLVLIGGAVYAFYRWWQADNEQLPARPKACPGCGAETMDSWKVCPHCARDLQRESVFCRSCSQPMLAAWKVCPSCSHAVNETPAAAEEVHG